MDNEATPVQLILLIEFGPDGVRATLLAAADDEPEPVRPNWESLTKRERIVAHLIGQALTNQQIASRIRVSPHTVNYHLRQIYRKLGVNSRAQLARLAGEVERSPR